MAYFPFLVDIEGKSIRIVGGGKVAVRKTEALMEYGARIFVTAPAVDVKIRRMAEESGGSVTVNEREFAEADLEGMDYVIAATDSPELNSAVSGMCRQKKIPVNVVDVEEECDFIFPAIIKKQDLLVAVSTGGNSPLFAARLKAELMRGIPDFYGKLVESLGSSRKKVLESVPEAEKRKKVFEELIERGILRGGELSDEDVDAAIEENTRGS